MREEVSNRFDIAPSDRINLSRLEIQDRELFEIIDRLSSLPNIHFIFLQGNNITDNGATLIASHAERLSHVKQINLEGNGIDREGMRALFSKLGCVDFSFFGNRLTDKGEVAELKEKARP